MLGLVALHQAGALVFHPFVLLVEFGAENGQGFGKIPFVENGIGRNSQHKYGGKYDEKALFHECKYTKSTDSYYIAMPKQMNMRIGVQILCAGMLLAGMLGAGCGRNQSLDAASLRGLPLEQLQQMREEILARHEDGSPLSDHETQRVELIRDQERRLENAWIFGEWRERHGARLIFRDDGTVSVGARGGVYDELGVYKFVSPEEPAYESVWNLYYDELGEPIAVVSRPDGSGYIYQFHRSRTEVYEWEGDVLMSSPTGYYFTKNL